MAYATVAEFQLVGIPSAALANVDLSTIEAHLEDASDLIDTYLRSQHTLPLASPYPRSITNACITIASYTFLTWRGHSPIEYDEQYRARYDDALDWLRMLAKGEVSLSPAADATPTVNEGAARVQTGGSERVGGSGTAGESRGW
jgi:phage gp36-like protein